MEQPVLSLERVTLLRGGRPVLDAVDLDVPAEGITVLAGASGSGKSSLLRLLNRLEAPTEGVVRFRGRDVAETDPLELRRRVGMVFQRPVPFPGTVRDNLHAAAAADDATLATVLARAGLGADALERRADDLSGGECQRMCLARALAAEPAVLLLDEPTSALDADATAVVEATATSLAAGGVPLVWVTHDGPQAERLADRIVTLADGRVAVRDGARAGRGGAG